MSAASFRGLAYRTTSKAVPGGHHVQVAVATCGRCPAEKSFRLPRGSNNPEAVQKLFRAEGWRLDAWVPGDVRCPACLAAAAEKRRGEKPEKPKSNGEKIVTLQIVKDAPAGDVPPGGLPPDKTTLTAADRARLRTLLDGLFDADKGYYIEAYSDAKVAAETDLPEKLVRDYREVAFGPLTAVPELEPLVVDLRGLEERSRTLLADAATVGDQVAALKRRVEETARRLGVNV